MPRPKRKKLTVKQRLDQFEALLRARLEMDAFSPLEREIIAEQRRDREAQRQNQ